MIYTIIIKYFNYSCQRIEVLRLKHSNLSTIPKKGRTKPSPLRAGEK